MMEFYIFDKSLPAAGLAEQFVKTDDTNINGALVRINTVPQAKLGSAFIIVQPRFFGIAGGTAIPMTVSAPDFSNTLPATAPNFNNAIGILTDTLGFNRTGSVIITLNAGGGRITSTEMTPVVSL